MTKEEKFLKETPINVVENSRSRVLHKFFLVFLKIIPMVMAGLYLLNTVLSYFNIDYSVISYLTGLGLIPWLFILVASYALKFCIYHRLFLWYIVANDIVCWTDYNFELPVSDREYLLLHFIVAGVFIFLVLYFHQKCRRKA
jgi:hypothetical protein